MTERLTIYSGPLSMFGAKVEIAAREKELDFDLVMVPYDSKVGYSPKHPEVLRVNPKKQVPVLVHGAVEIFDSTQIFEYLEDIAPSRPLWPRDPGARARARGLEHRSDELFFPHVVRLMSLQDALHTEPAVMAIDAANRYYADMNQLLDSNDWLAGSYSFADIAFYMASLFGERQGAPLTESTPRLFAWRNRMSQRLPVKVVVSAMATWLRNAGRPVPAFMAKI